MMPQKPSGSPTIWRNQSRATSSSSVAEGEVFQSIPLTFNAAHKVSAKIPGADPVIEK